MRTLLYLLRMHWKAALLILIVLLLLPAVVAALLAAEDEPAVAVPVEPALEQAAPSEPAAAEPGQAEPLSAEPRPLENQPAEAPPMDQPGEVVVETGGATQPFAEYRELIERPLFSSTRRPPVVRDAPQETLDGQQLREAWRLSGIAMEQGRQLASFSERQGEGRLLLEVGMVLADEWRLEQIGSDHVLLGNGGSEVRMPLREPVIREDTGEAGEAGATPAANRTPAQTDNPSPPANTPAPAVPAQ
jgi:hypothetical protein